MSKTLWNDNWEFYKASTGTDSSEAMDAEFNCINIPHDWLIYQGNDLYESSVGFYRKRFEIKKAEDKLYEVYFEGVYMDTTVYVNGQEVGQWKYGYSSFFFDITKALKDGANEIVVKVNYKAPNSRWYSGAGIYRNVWFAEKDKACLVTDSLYISTDNNRVIVCAEVSEECASEAKSYLVGLEIPEAGLVKYALLPEAMENAEKSGLLSDTTSDGSKVVQMEVVIDNPKLWSLSEPNLYTMNLTIIRNNHGKQENVDSISSSFGFRTLGFDTEKGFFLNGEHIKINGVCEHHDLGALGAAFNKSAMRRRLLILREMGVNAIRTAHNMPAPEFLELTDEMGFLVMDEAFDMWELSKTEYDYSRFFKEWQERDVRSWIRRDRNHPSIFMWSIGNEIYDTHVNEHGQEITACLMEEVKHYDPLGNAAIGIASNYMSWEGAQKCSDILKFAGYNYAERLYDEHHAKHPDWYIFGSETSSTLQSRGIYHFPLSQPGMTEIDEQCSSLGNCTSTWGAKNTEYCIIQDRDHEFSMGQFIWSGFDYIGEPTPYQTRNSYFGQIDTAGFYKDTAYICRAAWTDYRTAPFVHIYPYWCFNEGQMIDVRVASNAPSVLLFVNGHPLDRIALNQKRGDVFTADYRIPYTKGQITAIAYDMRNRCVAEETKYSFGNPEKIVAKLHYSQSVLESGKGDLAFVEITTIDKNGHPVENDSSLMKVEVSGAGWLTGLDNGDSTSIEEYKGNSRRLFAGKLLVIVAAGDKPGNIEIKISSDGLKSASLTIPVVEGEETKGISLRPEIFSDNNRNTDKWIRQIKLRPVNDVRTLGKDTQDVIIEAKCYPADAEQEIEWAAVTDTGIETPSAKIADVRNRAGGSLARVHALGDGNFRVRCITRNGERTAKVISELEFVASGLGKATINPYELVRGEMYSRSQGELANAIEHGIASGDGWSVITFDNLEMGDFGSDEIEIPIFELGGNAIPIKIWEGIPDEDGATLLADVVYHKPSIWNTYQSESYKLSKRVKGIATISLEFMDKVNVGGIIFTRLSKAFSLLHGSDRDAVFGDTFIEKNFAINDIGNNVTVEYNEMDFGADGTSRLSITGHTSKENNTIHVVFGDDADDREVIEFPGSVEVQTLTFDISKRTGKKNVKLIFLPGSKFDLEAIQFFY